MDNCRWNKEEETKVDNEPNQRKKPITEPKKVFVQTKNNIAKQGPNKEIINVEKEIINVEASSSKNQQSLKGKEVLPEKEKGRGKSTDMLLSPEVLLRQQDQELEDELNMESEKEASKEITGSKDTEVSS
ncbi:hypothetical protein A2U01_0045687, partial [Trifolium medium]|nr:hypothetical protein [Trifolium medium]